MPIKKNLKDDFCIIICGGILIVWGGLISGLPDSHIYSSFGLHEPSNSVYQLNEMDVKTWVDRMMVEAWIDFILFAVHYLIAVVGIIVATLGGVMSIRDSTKKMVKYQLKIKK